MIKNTHADIITCPVLVCEHKSIANYIAQDRNHTESLVFYFTLIHCSSQQIYFTLNFDQIEIKSNRPDSCQNKCGYFFVINKRWWILSVMINGRDFLIIFIRSNSMNVDADQSEIKRKTPCNAAIAPVATIYSIYFILWRIQSTDDLGHNILTPNKWCLNLKMSHPFTFDWATASMLLPIVAD